MKYSNMDYVSTVTKSVENWYHFAAIEYGVQGGLLAVGVRGDALILRWFEQGQDFVAVWKNFREYSPDAIVNMWEEGYYDEA